MRSPPQGRKTSIAYGRECLVVPILKRDASYDTVLHPCHVAGAFDPSMTGLFKGLGRMSQVIEVEFNSLDKHWMIMMMRMRMMMMVILCCIRIPA